MNEAKSTTPAKTGLSPTFRRALWASAAATLLFPAIAMRFSNEVNWSLGDFVAMGGLLAAFCTAVEIASALTLSRAAKIGFIGTSVFMFLAVWIELAVGIFD